MESVATAFRRAVAAHREAVSHLAAANIALDRIARDPRATEESTATQRQLSARLNALAGRLAPGWLGIPLESANVNLPMGEDASLNPSFLIRIGDAIPLPDTGFSTIVPFCGAGHIAIDRDARDEAVGRWLRGILLRTIAALPDGTLRVRPVDGHTLGRVFLPFRSLIDAEAWAPVATDLNGLLGVIEDAEAQIARAQEGRANEPPLLVACAALPPNTGRTEWSRLASIAHAGPGAGVYLLLAGYPPPLGAGLDPPPRLDNTTQLNAQGDEYFSVSEPPGSARFSEDNSGLAALIKLDPGPGDHLVEAVSTKLARSARVQSSTDFDALMPPAIWTESSATGLRTIVGRDGRNWCELALDDATPHWLVGGRTGSGKTVFVLDTLYGLAARYSPDELGLYLLDFKEGVSFAEFTPTTVDESWIPHARTVGIESDREYGIAVLRALSREMTRRATEFKRAGVTKLADLRENIPGRPFPRLLAVIDEFQVLFDGNDALARQAAALLEELARKGRSYGIHLILASQTISGVEALFTKTESIFGQFPLRVALAGGGGILDQLNDAADALPIGSVVINAAGGVPGRNRLIRFPNADSGSVTKWRRKLFESRAPGSPQPAVFAGYAEQHIAEDPRFAELNPKVRRRQALVGRAVDVGLPTAGFTLDASPGRHVAVLGTSVIGADVLHAATLALARQHQPGSATFILAPLVAAADEPSDEASDAIMLAGHQAMTVNASQYRRELARLAAIVTSTEQRATPENPTYLIVFGADAASGMLASSDSETFRTGHDDLRAVLANGPAYGIHLVGWWRTVRRFTDDLGHGGGAEVACLVALNVPASDLGSMISDFQLSWTPRTNRALLVDRHDDRRSLIVPFVRPGTLETLE